MKVAHSPCWLEGFVIGSFLDSRASRAAAISVVLFLCLSATPARATTVSVPDDYPTIQLAVDAQPDTVLIREGDYPERPVIGQGIMILGVSASGARPRLKGLLSRPAEYPSLRVKGIAFDGPIDLHSGSGFASLMVEDCTLDSGVVQREAYDTNEYAIVSILRSRIRGDVSVNPLGDLVCEADTFESAGVSANWVARLRVRNCLFTGYAGTAITAHGEAGCVVEGNTIRNCGVGISSHPGGYASSIRDNVIEDCTRWAIAVGGDGNAEVNGNRVRGGLGIVVGTTPVSVQDNVVLESTGDGIALESPNGPVERNVVGRSARHGIWIDVTGYGNPTIRNNTSYGNGGSGFVIESSDPCCPIRYERNLSYGNGSFGLLATNGATPELSCNDWFANTAGAVSGVSPSPDDLAVDPLFCELAIDDVRLAATSPLVDAPGCGQIGARGVGCGTTPTLVALFNGERVGEGVRLRWRLADPTRFVEVWAERSGAAPGPWARITTERVADGDGFVELDRSAAPAERYWYRLIAREGSSLRVIGAALAVQAEASLQKFTLVGARPNPSAGPVLIEFALAREADIEVQVFDVRGRRLASVAQGRLPAGAHVVRWSGRDHNGDAPSGLYFIRYRWPGGQHVRRIVRTR